MALKLKGAYKGNRPRPAPPAIIIIECPGCGWRSQPDAAWKAEIEYVLHLNNNHFGALCCAFCDGGNVIRFLPDFATLAAHVQHFHPQQMGSDPSLLPPRAFL